MTKQANEASRIDPVIMGSNFIGYAICTEHLDAIKANQEKDRVALEPAIREHKIPVGDNTAWKAKRAIFYPVFLDLESPRDTKGVLIALDAKGEKAREARVVAWLGVLRTCLEYQILPTTKNADRLRKKATWTRLNGNGMANPLLAKKQEAKPTESVVPTPNPVLSVEDAEKIVDKQIAAMDKADTKKAAAALDKMENVLDTATMTPSKNTTPQKDTAKGEIPRANVSSTDAPIHPIEHCSLLLDQLTKNEAFREIYAPILAIMLDVEKSTLTRCIVQARDEMLRGAK